MQGGRREDNYRRMYDDAMDGVDELLVQKVGGSRSFPAVGIRSCCMKKKKGHARLCREGLDVFGVSCTLF